MRQRNSAADRVWDRGPPARLAGGTPVLRAGPAILLALSLALPLTGCGKKNAPEPPPGVPNTYPLPYPRE
jgi:hypothetical protein